MGPLVAVGGLHIQSDRIKVLETGLEQLCQQNGLGRADRFKWSPGPELRFARCLVDDARSAFFASALDHARQLDVRATVVVVDVHHFVLTPIS
jgi:hypothetical protein